MMTLSCPGPLPVMFTFGRNLSESSNVVTFSCARVSPVSAWMVIGTSWTLSVRRWAVTMTSSIPPLEAPDCSAEPAAAAAEAAAPACALKIAMTADETL